jgi:hypothetical protein
LVASAVVSKIEGEDAYMTQGPVHGVVERAIERSLHLVRCIDGNIAIVNLAYSVQA